MEFQDSGPSIFNLLAQGPHLASSLSGLIHLAAVGFYKKYKPVFPITVQIPRFPASHTEPVFLPGSNPRMHGTVHHTPHHSLLSPTWPTFIVPSGSVGTWAATLVSAGSQMGKMRQVSEPRKPLCTEVGTLNASPLATTLFESLIVLVQGQVIGA